MIEESEDDVDNIGPERTLEMREVATDEAGA
jgi:hypothetical protein